MFDFGPSISQAASASRMRASARGRSASCTISLAIIGS
jgi:hypothetical protein